MAAAKTTAPVVQYHVTDAQGNHAVLQPGAAAKTVTIGLAGQTGAVFSQQNVTDLLSALTSFASTGVLT